MRNFIYVLVDADELEYIVKMFNTAVEAGKYLNKCAKSVYRAAQKHSIINKKYRIEKVDLREEPQK